MGLFFFHFNCVPKWKFSLLPFFLYLFLLCCLLLRARYCPFARTIFAIRDLAFYAIAATVRSAACVRDFIGYAEVKLFLFFVATVVFGVEGKVHIDGIYHLIVVVGVLCREKEKSFTWGIYVYGCAVAHQRSSYREFFNSN